MSEQETRAYEENLPLEQINSFMYQRQQINEAKLNEQAESIKSKGVIEPIHVRPAKDGYQLMAGYLRFVCAQKNGFKTIPAIVHEGITDIDATDILMIENLHRQELSDLDEANILNMYVDQHGLQQKEIAERLDVSPAYVSLKLKLLEDKEPLREAISKGSVTEQQARMLRVLPNTKALKDVIPQVEGKTVKETREIVSEAQAKYVKDSLKEQIKDYEEKIKAITEFEKERDKLQEQIDKTTGELKALKTEDKETNRAIKNIMELEKRYFPAVEEITKLTAQLNDLRKTRPENVDHFVQTLEKDRKAVYDEQAKVKAQIDDLGQKLKELREAHKKKQEQASALTQQLNELKANEEKFQQAKRRLDELKDLVAKYQKSHKSAIDGFEQLKSKVEQADKEILAKRTALAEKIAVMSKEKQTLNGKIANKENYQKAISVLRQKLKSL